MSLPQFYAVPEHRVRFGDRLLIYLAVWLLAALAFQVFLRPDGLAETNLTPIQQRIRWPLYTPIMAVVGLAEAVTWPVFPGSSASFLAAMCFLIHAIIALTRARRRWFVALTCSQVVLLAVAVIYFVRQSQLPSGP